MPGSENALFRFEIRGGRGVSGSLTASSGDSLRIQTSAREGGRVREAD